MTQDVKPSTIGRSGLQLSPHSTFAQKLSDRPQTMTHQTDDLRILDIHNLLSPEQIRARSPLT
ncbi:MAG TPA: hypothetical protein PLD79_03630, partial [Halothiobacillus sp.]|nr:hypothetical protein [Halothiobacillus sp.]